MAGATVILVKSDQRTGSGITQTHTNRASGHTSKQEPGRDGVRGSRCGLDTGTHILAATRWHNDGIAEGRDKSSRTLIDPGKLGIYWGGAVGRQAEVRAQNG